MKHRPLALVLIALLLAPACSADRRPAASVTPRPPSSTATATRAPTPTATATPSPTPGVGSSRVSPADGMEVVYVPAGPFIMGLDYPPGTSPSHAVELQPPQIVTLDAFWIDRTEVTNGMYALCVADGVCEPPIQPLFTTRTSYYGNSLYDDYPVLGASWENAVAYCAWAGRHLPTEAEWEKAARGWDERLYPWGSAPPNCELANYRPCGTDTLPVGSLPEGASPYGALDMAGNVWEWVADWYGPEAYPTPFPVQGQEPTTATLHVVRGGSWANAEIDMLCGYRFYGWPIDEISVGFGFRCASDAAP